ncbi:MAG: T9SS type A sorting domain-containing protein [Bacteroidia bacterium]|nr:T9SS type A sorting domain-containing protein [Bacteroidia bacterium]
MKKYCLIFITLLTTLSYNILSAQDVNPADFPTLVGYWKFQDTGDLTKATVGNDLIKFGTDKWVQGPAYGDTAIQIGLGSYYRCYHNISPNGGGVFVNEYTMMFDFMVENLTNWRTFYQTNTTNSNDGEYFIKPDNGSLPGAIGSAQISYDSVFVVQPYQWYRLVLSVKNDSFYRIYINGNLLRNGNFDVKDDRYSLKDNVLFFADNNGEDDTINIASLAIFSSSLNATEVKLLGTIEPCIAYPILVELGSDTAFCDGGSVTKSLPVQYAYKWLTGDTSSTVTFNTAKLGIGTRSIWVEAKDINNCIKRDTFKVTIAALPVPALGSDTSLCVDSGAVYNLKAGYLTGNSFEWKKLPSDSIISVSNSYNVAKSGVYAVKMKTSYGCVGYDTVDVTMNINPPKPIISYNALQLCEGDTFNISTSPGFAFYHWNNGQTAASFDLTQSAGLVVNVETAEGCISPKSDSIYFYFNPLPPKPQVYVIPDSVFCAGDSVSLFIIDAYQSILWNDGNQTSMRDIKQSGVYSVQIVDMNGCTSPRSDEVKIEELTRPDNPVLLSQDGADFCEGDTARFTCQTNAELILWSNGDTGIATYVLSSGKFSVTAQNLNGCFSLEEDSLEILFHPIPDEAVFVIYGKDSIASAFSASLYEWKVDDVLQGNTEKSLPIVFNKKISLRLGNGFCWSEWTDTTLSGETSVNSIFSNTFRMFPNPTQSMIEFDFDQPINRSTLEVNVFSLDGKRVFAQQGCQSAIDLSNLEAGQYIVYLISDATIFVGRLIKQ